MQASNPGGSLLSRPQAEDTDFLGFRPGCLERKRNSTAATFGVFSKVLDPIPPVPHWQTRKREKDREREQKERERVLQDTELWKSYPVKPLPFAESSRSCASSRAPVHLADLGAVIHLNSRKCLCQSFLSMQNPPSKTQPLGAFCVGSMVCRLSRGQCVSGSGFPTLTPSSFVQNGDAKPPLLSLRAGEGGEVVEHAATSALDKPLAALVRNNKQIGN